MKQFITYAKRDDSILPYEAPHRQLARRAASEGIVLLENKGVLPLKIKRIALFGAGASHTIKGGTGSGEVNERYSVSILEGLKAAGFQISTQSWLNDYKREYEQGLANIEAEIRSALKKLDISTYMGLFLKSYLYPFGRKITEKDVAESQTDTCIYVVARQSGEGADRRLENFDFQLSDIEKENIRFCAEHYKKTVVVLNIGSSFDTSFMNEIPGIGALIYFCQQGTAGGNAFADIITGAVTPSGKLADTWFASYSDIPYGSSYSYLNGNLDNEDYLEDIYVGYRYCDTFRLTPQYPFGYGLSYTDFTIRYNRITKKRRHIVVSATVTNTGTTYSGKEVIQLYVSCPTGKLSKEYQRLCAFAKTRLLAPGESDTVTLAFPFSYLTSYDTDSASSILENGRYLLRLGNSSRNTTVCAAIDLLQDICVYKHKNICPPQKALSVLTLDTVISTRPENNGNRLLTDKDILTLLPEDVPTRTYTYHDMPICPDKKILTILKSLSISERISLVTGAGLKDMLMNESYVKVPGAAGNTTSSLLSKDIPNIALADGPAGLRLQRRSAIFDNGRTKMIDMQFDMMKHFPDFIKRLFCGNPETDPVYYQYTTAFPVETALAQTWNTDLLEEIGQAVGAEMREYGVTFWLAPALNIHRNPLCGRNYEYYSEDPVLSGKMAAAITRGVQQHKGRYVTLKHFAANNQEENRDHVSSNMTERALREIYLKGFEIAVREGKAQGIMTSYNKVNGVYTSNSKDLITHVLRREWGFGGLVMTDWTATSRGKSDPALCIEAGNDLLMPGSSYDKKSIRRALQKKTLSRKALNRCAANVLKAVLEGRADRQ